MSQIILQPVAVVRSPFKRPEDVLGRGTTVEVEVASQFERELEGVERSSHLIIVGYFHKNMARAQGAAQRRHAPGQACGASLPDARSGQRRFP